MFLIGDQSPSRRSGQSVIIMCSCLTNFLRTPKSTGNSWLLFVIDYYLHSITQHRAIFTPEIVVKVKTVKLIGNFHLWAGVTSFQQVGSVLPFRIHFARRIPEAGAAGWTVAHRKHIDSDLAKHRWFVNRTGFWRCGVHILERGDANSENKFSKIQIFAQKWIPHFG